MKLPLSMTVLPFILESARGAGRTLGGKAGKGGKTGGEAGGVQTLTLSVLNEAYRQPFSPFFIMVHNSDVDPLYVRGDEASDALAVLAENGNGSELVDYYSGMEGVMTAMVGDGPTPPGATTEIEVLVSAEYPLVTIAAMAVNTNDCFVAVNGMQLTSGMVLDVPGLDAGSEENNENCSSIPGPACADNSGNTSDGEGEGFVHVHRGVMGISDLTLQEDWRNPMMRVSVN